MRFTIISDPNYTAGGTTDFRVHREGCADIAKHTRKPPFLHAGSSWTIEADSAEAAVAEQVADFQHQQQGYGPADFTILPCCKGKG